MTARALPGPPPGGPSELLGVPLHRIVMAWPETLATLRGAGLDLAEEGGRALGDLEGAPERAEELLRATAWRRP